MESECYFATDRNYITELQQKNMGCVPERLNIYGEGAASSAAAIRAGTAPSTHRSRSGRNGNRKRRARRKKSRHQKKKREKDGARDQERVEPPKVPRGTGEKRESGSWDPELHGEGGGGKSSKTGQGLNLRSSDKKGGNKLFG